jgi:hypothetical protein
VKTLSRILFRFGIVLGVLYAIAALVALLASSWNTSEALGITGFGLGIPAVVCLALGWVVQPADAAPLARRTVLACAASLVIGLALAASIVVARMHAAAKYAQNIQTAKIPCASPLADAACKVARGVTLSTTSCDKDEFFCTAFVFTSADGKSKYTIELTGIDAAAKLVKKLNDGTVSPVAAEAASDATEGGRSSKQGAR